MLVRPGTRVTSASECRVPYVRLGTWRSSRSVTKNCAKLGEGVRVDCSDARMNSVEKSQFLRRSGPTRG